MIEINTIERTAGHCRHVVEFSKSTREAIYATNNTRNLSQIRNNATIAVRCKLAVKPHPTKPRLQMSPVRTLLQLQR